MPMIDIQRRHQTIFRIRFGEKLSNRPTKLTDSIRVTAANPDVVDAFIDVYGGKRKAWEQQWEAKLPTTALNILVLPGQSISQWWEKYRGSVCDRRCDGRTEMKANKPCMCDPNVEVRTADAKQCSPTTRVSVICPDVAVVGSGMFVCHGLVGAETLPQSIAVAEAALSRGLMVPAVLRVVEFRGLNHFIVPQIEVVGTSFNALAAAAATGQLQHATKEIEAPAAHVVDGPRFTPINGGGQAPAVAPPQSLRDQFGEFHDQSDEKQRARGQRANAAAPLPATGVSVKPRGGVPPTSTSSGGAGDGAESAPGGVAGDVPAPSPDSVQLVNADGAKNVAMRCADAGVGDDRRAALLWAFSEGAYKSSHDVPVDSLGELWDTLRQVRSGELVLVTDTNGEHPPRLLTPGDVPFGHPGVGPDAPPPSELVWRELLGQRKGVAQAKLLRRARDLCNERDLDLPRDLNEIPAVIEPDLRSWLEEFEQAS